MLNKELEQTLNEAFVFAREHRHEFMTVEHKGNSLKFESQKWTKT